LDNIHKQILFKTRSNILKCQEGYKNSLFFKTRSNILKCQEGFKNSLFFIIIMNLKDLKTNKRSSKMNNNIIQISFNCEINFSSRFKRMITYIKNFRIILANTNMKKITSNRIQFFQNLSSRIKLPLVQKIKIFLIKISKTILSTRHLSNNSEHTFSIVIMIIKCVAKDKS